MIKQYCRYDGEKLDDIHGRFTFFPNVTVCNTCLTQFPYYECLCELKHDNCNEETREANIAYRVAERQKLHNTWGL